MDTFSETAYKAATAKYKIPDFEERNAVFKYLLTKGFTQEKAKSFDCLGLEYKLARDGMKYQAMQQGVTP